MAKRKNNTSKCIKYPNFSALPHKLLKHPDFLSMTWAAQAVLIHMCAIYNGFNNGNISLAKSYLEEIGWPPSTVNTVKKELIEKNWIYVTRQGGNKICNLFALTWQPIDMCSIAYDAGVENLKLRSLNS